MAQDYHVITNDNHLGEIVYEHFMPIFRNGYVEIGEKKHCMPVNYIRIMDRINDFEVKEDDIIVASHPKTGTTWIQEMIWMIMNNLDYDGAKQGLGTRFPFLEVTALFNFKTLVKKIKEFKPSEIVIDSVAYVNKMASPRFIKTHLPFSLLPKQLQEGSKSAKMIYVYRNPKDTCISYYHHCRLIEGYTGNFEDFCKLFLGGKVSFGPYIQHVLSYWEKRHNKNILLLQFEEMKKDLPAVIEKVSKFLNKILSAEQIRELEKHLSFESMKDNPAVNGNASIEIFKSFKLTDHDGTFMRTGSVGNFTIDMTKELIEEFDNWTNEQLKGSNFKFEL